ncbi:MAG TPA: hypothetical protein VHY33_15125 [Thermoanaerobaculia bacterium]|jgi:hypothetical protein|nr:hypothetical protein [Thermoanaerobaculia bacterium]
MIAELSFIALALAIGIPLALRLSAPPREPFSRAGEGMLIGIGICAATLVLLPWSRWLVIAVILLIAAIAWTRSAAEPPRSYGAILVLALLLGYALYATVAPPPEYDYLTNWGFKAKAFFEIRAIDWRLLESPPDSSVHADYPLLLPLTYDFIGVLRNGWNDAHLGVVHVAFAAALLLIIHASSLQETHSRLAAAFIAIALIPLAATPWIGLAEGPFIAYATASLLAIRRGDVILGAVLLGLAASTKNEGLALIVAVAIGLLCAGRKRDVLRLWPALAIAMPWLIARLALRLPTDIATDGVIARMIEHARDPAGFVAALASFHLGKPLYWIGLAAGMAITFRTIITRERFVLIALLVQFVSYLGAYLATPFGVLWHVTWSWERLVAHLTPALTYVVLVQLVGTVVTARTHPTHS